MNGKVRILKKAEKATPQVAVAPPKTARLAAREMVSTVSDWVAEFKTRRSEETKAAIEKLLPNQPNLSES